MEEQPNNLCVRTKTIEQILPTLATKDDVAEFKRYMLMLNEATRRDIRLLGEHVIEMRAQLDRIENRRT
jgi:hypothetical protein